MQKILILVFLFALPLFITRFSIGNFTDTEISTQNGLVAGIFTPTPTPALSPTSAVTPTTTIEPPTPTATPSPTQATELPILINEIYVDGIGSNEWVELYNPNNFSVNITGWNISDGDGNSGDTLPTVNSIQANSFAVILPDNTTKSALVPLGVQQIIISSAIGNNLNDNGDKVVLKKSDLSESDKLSYGNDTSIFTLQEPDTNKSLSRIPNGTDTNTASDWTVSNNPTIGSTNQP